MERVWGKSQEVYIKFTQLNIFKFAKTPSNDCIRLKVYEQHFGILYIQMFIYF